MYLIHLNMVSGVVKQYISALSVCLGAVAAGAVLGWTSNVEEKLKKGNLGDLRLGETELGWVGSLLPLGAMCMCFPIGFICDILGRKLTMLLTICPFTVGWLLVIFASNTGMLYGGRFLTGMAGGAFCVTAPLYTSEIAQKEIRGSLGTFFQLLLTVGILFAYILGKFMESVQHYTIICAIVPYVFGVVFFLQPETPVYLLKKNKADEALSSLKRLRDASHDCDAELKQIREEIEQEQANKVSFMTSVKTTASKKAIIICFGLMLFQQLSGINAVIFYTSSILKSSGSSIDPADATIYVGIVQVVVTGISSLVIDRFGRKILLVISDACMMLSILALGIFVSLQERKVIDDETVKTYGFIPIICIMLFIGVFSLGFGPIPWIASSEIFPPEIRANASSAAATFNWFLAFIVAKFYKDMNTGIGGDVTLFIFAGISLLGTIFVLLVLPETKGKTSAEVQEMLSGKKPSKTGIVNPGYST